MYNLNYTYISNYYQVYKAQMKLLIFLLFCPLVLTSSIKLDYFLYVQLWPGSWLYSDHSKYPFSNDYFTIHGLWPEYRNGSWPQFCNASKFDGQALNPIKNDLTKYWTDFKNPKKFWSHEYYKHMSCLEEDPIFQNEYVCFKMGLHFRNYYDYYHALNKVGIVPSNQQNYTVSQVSNAIQSLVGTTPVIVCDNHGILNEIRICFDQNVNNIDCPKDEIIKGCLNTSVWYNVV